MRWMLSAALDHLGHVTLIRHVASQTSHTTVFRTELLFDTAPSITDTRIQIYKLIYTENPKEIIKTARDPSAPRPSLFDSYDRRCPSRRYSHRQTPAHSALPALHHPVFYVPVQTRGTGRSDYGSVDLLSKSCFDPRWLRLRRAVLQRRPTGKHDVWQDRRLRLDHR